MNLPITYSMVEDNQDKAVVPAVFMNNDILLVIPKNKVVEFKQTENNFFIFLSK